MFLFAVETEPSEVTTISTLPENETVPDYDGTNVTVTNTTQDHHRYYNRYFNIFSKLHFSSEYC